MDRKNKLQLQKAYKALDAILNDFDFSEYDSKTFNKFFDARKELEILLRDSDPDGGEKPIKKINRGIK